jgi:hypothetical protein
LPRERLGAVSWIAGQRNNNPNTETVMRINKLTSTLAAVAAISAFALAAPAQLEAQRPLSLGVSAGLSLPNGDMADVLNSGYHIGGHLNLVPATFPVEIHFDVTYHSFDENNDILAPFTFTYLNVGANAAYVLPGIAVRPYLLGGIGMYMGKSDFGNVTSDTESELGFAIGAGARFVMSGISSFVQLRMNFVDDWTFMPISFGVLF